MNRVRANIVLLVFICVNWAICCLVIWWRYQINLLIRVGSYQRDEAMSAVGKMSLISYGFDGCGLVVCAPQGSKRIAMAFDLECRMENRNSVNPVRLHCRG